MAKTWLRSSELGRSRVSTAAPSPSTHPTGNCDVEPTHGWVQRTCTSAAAAQPGGGLGGLAPPQRTPYWTAPRESPALSEPVEALPTEGAWLLLR